LGPALDVAGKAVDEFGNHHVGPAWGTAGQSAVKASRDVAEWIEKHLVKLQ